VLTNHGCVNKKNSEKEIVDLSYSINPYGMPEQVQEALKESCFHVTEYPEIDSYQLRALLAKRNGIAEKNIQLGNGASELIYALCRVLDSSRKVLIIEPTFTEYGAAAAAAGIEIEHYLVKVKNRFRFAESDCVNVVDMLSEEYSAVFICNPNNPTATIMTENNLIKLLETCKKHDIKLIVDECFWELSDYGNSTGAIALVNKYDNLVVLRAFTKSFAMPGVRLGYLVCGDSEWMGKMKGALPPWNISVMAQMSGVAALTENEEYSVDSYLEQSIAFIVSERKKIVEKLKSCEAVKEIYDSCVNFIFVCAEVEFYRRLCAEGVVVRKCDDFYGLDEKYYRIAVGTKVQNEKLILLLEEF